MIKQGSFLLGEKNISPYQAATFRILLGLFFLVQGWQLEMASNALVTEWQAFTLGAASFFLILGRLRKIAALILWLILAWICLRQPLLEPNAVGLMGLLLLFQVLLPAGEGLQFRKLKADPGWRFPSVLFLGSWILLAIYYGWNGILMCLSPSWIQGTALKEILHSILAGEGWLRSLLLNLPDGALKGLSFVLLGTELLFPFLGLIRKVRPWAWLLMLGVQIFWFFLLNDGMGSLGLILFQLWIFDPDWFPARKVTDERSLVLYDGVCGLCNGTVQFLLREDEGKTLLFTPLQGKTSESILDEKSRKKLSSVVYIRDWQTDHSKRFTHSDAVLQLLKDLGGFWAVVSWFKWVPRFLRNTAYEAVAKIRYRVFGKYESCPLPNPEDRERFLD